MAIRACPLSRVSKPSTEDVVEALTEVEMKDGGVPEFRQKIRPRTADCSAIPLDGAVATRVGHKSPQACSGIMWVVHRLRMLGLGKPGDQAGCYGRGASSLKPGKADVEAESLRPRQVPHYGSVEVVANFDEQRVVAGSQAAVAEFVGSIKG